MKLLPAFLTVSAFCLLPGAAQTAQAADGVPRMAVLRPSVETRLANGGWDYDRYTNLEPLAAGKQITVADLAGPGIIRAIHTTRHKPEELTSRGVVLEIYFDDAQRPAVMCPLKPASLNRWASVTYCLALPVKTMDKPTISGS